MLSVTRDAVSTGCLRACFLNSSTLLRSASAARKPSSNQASNPWVMLLGAHSHATANSNHLAPFSIAFAWIRGSYGLTNLRVSVATGTATASIYLCTDADHVSHITSDCCWLPHGKSAKDATVAIRQGLRTLAPFSGSYGSCCASGRFWSTNEPLSRAFYYKRMFRICRGRAVAFTQGGPMGDGGLMPPSPASLFLFSGGLWRAGPTPPPFLLRRRIVRTPPQPAVSYRLRPSLDDLGS